MISLLTTDQLNILSNATNFINQLSLNQLVDTKLLRRSEAINDFFESLNIIYGSSNSKNKRLITSFSRRLKVTTPKSVTSYTIIEQAFKNAYGLLKQYGL